MQAEVFISFVHYYTTNDYRSVGAFFVERRKRKKRKENRREGKEGEEKGSKERGGGTYVPTYLRATLLV